jgi:hypothetical protein
VAGVPLDVLARYSRVPDQVTAGGPADEFLRLACLTYSDADDPARWARAAEILRADPRILDGNVHVAAAAADAAELGRILTAAPAAASREGGPFQWTPLCYLAWAITHGMTERLRLLLAHGAPPCVLLIGGRPRQLCPSSVRQPGGHVQ